MVIDTSAVVAILGGEPEAERFARAVASVSQAYISAVNLLECYLVLSGEAQSLERFINDGEVEVKDFTLRTCSLAHAAFVSFGKGRHRAKLNFGDCAAYATAKEWDLPLLFKGNDFALTDVKRVVA